MYFVFEYHEDYFHSKFNKKDPSTFKELDKYDESLRAQGQTVLAMLDDLMTENDQKSFTLPEAIMAINIYLNNVSNTLLVRTFLEVYEPKDSQYNEVDVYKNEFQKARTHIKAKLRQSIGENCTGLTPESSYYNIISRDSKTQSQGHERLNALLYDRYSYAYDNTLKQLELYADTFSDSDLAVKYLMSPILNRQTYVQYYPQQMLFYDMLYRAELDIDQVNWLNNIEPDDLELLRDVTLVTKLKDGTNPDIEILFSMAQRCFEVKCVEAFQQQVLAATAHPLMLLVGSYVSLVKHMFYTGDDKFGGVSTRVELFGERINDLGEFILNTMVGFIRLGLYTENDLDYLKQTALELDNLVKYNDKENIQGVKPNWIRQIFRRCSTPMHVNLLNASNKEEVFTINSEENCNNTINALRLRAEKVGKYVENLDKYKSFYHRIIGNRFFSHENIFLYRPVYDIVQLNRNGYQVIVGSRPKIKSHEGPNLMDA
ncbi:uncharacterized protein LOC126839519 isoform X1 [Adelges cooleyi]|uniref:uncharacterized protein LOC126839519 isoform X1 n=1 Tax=Adelges cooleyi TaxID=133065 RepID=UPI00217FD2F6|nr:uncharacterized protein LOC126839519 isoform X1 [Adelges cooleyi]XP_050430821.1 uncharacterized protein LOC126839519 isoform X1 [Adelges cooleyi]